MGYDKLPRPDFARPLAQQSTPTVRTILDRNRTTSGSGTTGLWTPVRKSVDETRITNAVLSLDGTLLLPIAASQKYAVRAKVFFDTVAAADFKWALTGPSLIRGRFQRHWIIPGGAAFAGVAVDVTYTASQSVAGAGTTGGFVEFSGVFTVGANAGIFGFQWAQDTSDAGSTTVLAGSFLDYMVL